MEENENLRHMIDNTEFKILEQQKNKYEPRILELEDSLNIITT